MIRVIKIGGNIVDNPDLLKGFVRDFAAMPGMKILVHGGGVMASQMQKSMGMTPVMVEGRRVTDEDTLKIVTMVYAGWCNKNITALLQGEGCNAIGLCGADADVIRADRRPPVKVEISDAEAASSAAAASMTPAEEDGFQMVDYGYVGDVKAASVNAEFIYSLLERGIVPVFNAINHDGNGNLLNTNADTIASSIAIAMAGSECCRSHEVELIYCFEKDGVLYDKDDDDSVIPAIDRSRFAELKAEGRVADGMIPKLSNSFKAIDNGVRRVIIKHARNLLNDRGTVLQQAVHENETGLWKTETKYMN